jgi:pyruvate dehydrogenase E1 component alpha subunit
MMGVRTPYRFAPDGGDPEPYSVLDQSGILAPGAAAMDDHLALEALKLMLLSRTFDDKAISLQRQGRFGTYSAVRGQEASVVGAAIALDPARDWVVPQYRELPALVRQGMPLDTLALYYLGHPLGCVIPKSVNITPIQISLAAQLPHAVGLAWGLRHQGSDGVVVTFVGDGASSEGDFHESLNLAGLRKAPVIFFLQNNGWAISTPRRLQSAARTLAERAVGYGIEGVYVDGNDLFAVHELMREAVARARRGDGPTLIESRTWRDGAHNTADDPTRYVRPEEQAPWAGTDPVLRLQKYLAGRDIWTEELAAEVAEETASRVEQAMAAARATPPPESHELFDHVYAIAPDRMKVQRAQWDNATEVQTV